MEGRDNKQTKGKPNKYILMCVKCQGRKGLKNKEYQRMKNTMY